MPVFTILATGLVSFGIYWLTNRRQDARDRLRVNQAARERQADRLREMFAGVMGSVVLAQRALRVETRVGFERITTILDMTRNEYGPRVAIERDGLPIVDRLNRCYDLSLTYLAWRTAQGERPEDDPSVAAHESTEISALAQRLAEALEALETALIEHMAALDTYVEMGR